jgi:hypothetical protein
MVLTTLTAALLGGYSTLAIAKTINIKAGNMATSMATGMDTTKVVKPEKITPSITLKLRTIRKGIAATTSTWEIETNTSRDIGLAIKVAMTMPSTIVREGSLRSMAVKTLAKIEETVM